MSYTAHTDAHQMQPMPPTTNIYGDANTTGTGGGNSSSPRVIALGIPPASRLRIGLCVVFAIAYAIGAVMMGTTFSNTPAAIGFTCTTVMVLFYVVLVRHAPESVQHCTFLSRTRQGIFLFATLVVLFVSLSIYQLVLALQTHQAWNGDSHFCAFIAFLMAAKWSLWCGLRVKFFREVAYRLVLQGNVTVVAGVPVVHNGGGEAAGNVQQCPMGFHQPSSHQEQHKLLSANM